MNGGETGWRKISGRQLPLLVLCLAGVAAVLALARVGIIGSDDLEYYNAGRALSVFWWNAPTGFGGMRSAVTLPIALSLRAFGDHEWSVLLPFLLYALGVAAVTVFSLGRLLPARAALATTLLYVSLPAVAITSTMASADIAELFWSVCAFWLLMAALRQGGAAQSLSIFLAGGCIAFAFAARETSSAMILWMGVGFLFGFGLPRPKYFLAAAGFLAVMALECGYFASTLGDPLARFHALGETRSVVSRMAVPPFTFDDTGNFRIHGTIDPFVMLLTKQSFGVLYWAMLALLVAAWRGRRKNLRAAAGEERGRLLAGPFVPAMALGIVWALFASLALMKLRIHPRYYLAPTYFLLVAAALWLHSRPNAVGRGTLWLAVCLLALGNAVGIGIENKNPRFAERALAELVASRGEIIHTDPDTAHVASVFARWAGARPELIVATPPVAGDLVFRVMSGIGAANRERSPIGSGGLSGMVLEIWASPPLLHGLLADRIRAATFIPAVIRDKLTLSRSSAQLLKMAPQPGGSGE